MSAGNVKKRAKLNLPDVPQERPLRMQCRNCGERFSDANVYSEAGWLETRISGLCEVCFDTLADLLARDADDEHDNGEGRG